MHRKIFASSKMRRRISEDAKIGRREREREREFELKKEKASSGSNVLDVSKARCTGRATSLSSTHWFSATIIIGQVESSDVKALPYK
jgi:hypothetical protein